MKTKKIKVKQGFTIVELVIVIGVIGVLTAVLVPTFINLNKKAEMASQQSFLKNVNTQLAMRQAEGGKLDTMYDAIQVADEMGFDVEKISPIDGNDIVFDMKAKRFAMLKGEEVTFSDGGLKGAGVEIWKIADSSAKAAEISAAGYSIYAKESWNIGNLAAIKVGFDAGKNMTATSVSYSDSTTQAAIIRTNTGAIKINAPAGKVKHYGKAESVDIQAIAPSSYHEKGKIGFANIKNGRLVIEEEAKIEGVYLEETSGSFNDIKIALVGKAELPSVARSDVSMNDGDKKLVVELQTLSTPEADPAKQEYVWISKEAGAVSSSVSSSATDASAVIETPTAAAAAVKEEAKEAAAPIDANSQVRIGAVGYATFDGAVDEVSEGGSISLLKDISFGEDRSVPVWEKYFNVDLNGHTFTTDSNVGFTLSNNGYTASALCFAYEGSHAATVSNGVIKTAYGAGIYAASQTVYIRNVDITQNYPENQQTTDEYSSAVRLSSGSKVVIDGGSFRGRHALAVSNSGGEVTINGGTFHSDLFFSSNTNSGVTKSITINDGSFPNFSVVNANKGTLVINGGTFSSSQYTLEQFQAFVAQGKTVTTNSDGSWTVK